MIDICDSFEVITVLAISLSLVAALLTFCTPFWMVIQERSKSTTEREVVSIKLAIQSGKLASDSTYDEVQFHQVSSTSIDTGKMKH